MLNIKTAKNYMLSVLILFIKYIEKEKKTMKKRIISAVLVVVMSVFALVGCGYNFVKKDMSKNASFANGMNANSFSEALKALKVEDATFSHDEAKREKLVNDYIYKILVSKVDAKAELKEGDLDANDKVYFNYYAEYTKNEGDAPTIIYPSKMGGTAESVELGYTSEALAGKNGAIRDAIKAAMTEGSLKFEDYAFKTNSDSKKTIYEYVNADADKKVTVYITYTVNEKVANGESTKDSVTTYKYVQLTIDATEGAANSFLAQQLLATKAKSDTDSTLVGKYNLNTKITDAIYSEMVDPDGEGEAEAVETLIVAPVAPVAPVEPVEPTLVEDPGADATEEEAAAYAKYLEDKAAYDTAKAQYDLDKAAYDTAKAEYDEAKDEYDAKIAAVGTKAYKDITVHFAVESDLTKFIKVEYKLETALSGVDVNVGNNISVPVDTTVTYYVYPVHYLDVMELTAENIINTDDLTKELLKNSKLDKYLESVNKKPEGSDKSYVDLFKEAVTALKDAEKAYDDAKLAWEGNDTTDSAQKKFNEQKNKAIDEVIDKLTKEIADETDATQKEALQAKLDAVKALSKDTPAQDETNADVIANGLYTAAKDVYEKAKKAYEEADVALNGVPASEGEDGTEIPAQPGAKEKKETALKNLLDKLGEDGANKVVENYQKSVYDMKAAAYEEEMTTHIGQAVWKLMQDSVVINELPKKAVKEAYERFYNEHKYTFYATGTYYKDYNGDFNKYLIKVTIGLDNGDINDAKDYITKQAEERVKEIVIIHFIAEQLNLELSKKELKEARGVGAARKQNDQLYGEMNIVASAQIDKLFDYFLEVEMTTNADGTEEVKKNEETGAKIYKHVGIAW